MLQKKPKNHTVLDMYRAWYIELVKNNTAYFTLKDEQIKLRGVRTVYERTSSAQGANSEILRGDCNGSNKAFQTANRYWANNKVTIFKNGIKLDGDKGSRNRAYYLVPGKHMIIFLEAPKEGDILKINYNYLPHRMIMNYTMFRFILETYNKYAADAIIQGHKFDLGGNLGYLFPARIERSFTVSKVDVVATVNKRRTDPTHPAIYFTSPDYCMIKWHKNYRTRNETVYTFVTAKTKMRRDFYASNKKNPFLKTNYKFYPAQRQQSA